MDTLTHALSGALLARATGRAPSNEDELTLSERSWVGFAAAAFPDCDFVLLLVDQLSYLNWHRGITHSLLLLPLWSFLLAWLFSLFFRRVRRRPTPWQAFLGVCALGLGMHIAGDLITAYGTQILAPFSSHKWALSTTFIIDPWFTGILLLGLLASRWRPQASAGLSLLLLLGYVGFQATLQREAIALGTRMAQTQGSVAYSVHALPQPLSPFHWKVVIVEGDRYQSAGVHLRASHSPAHPPPEDAFFLRRVAAAYRAPHDLRWTRHQHFGSSPEAVALAREAWDHENFHGFRRFAAFPVVYRLDKDCDRTCVWFADLRFVLEGMLPPFRYGMCRPDAASPWLLHRLRQFSLNASEALTS